MSEVSTGRRAFRFYAVGGLGIAVQLASLAVLTHGGLNYVIATALAVEAAVVHNFVWHQHYTWGERRTRGIGAFLWRLLKFNATTGLVSIGGNVILMRLLVGEAGFRPLVANIVTIASCSLLNFLVSDRAVFRPPPLLGFNGSQ
ncbi:MAG TPA: GtrA family protein [Terriglobales bacterium]|nr:GtrA family protein [Terriglobales bacterium]